MRAIQQVVDGVHVSSFFRFLNELRQAPCVINELTPVTQADGGDQSEAGIETAFPGDSCTLLAKDAVSARADETSNTPPQTQVNREPTRPADSAEQ